MKVKMKAKEAWFWLSEQYKKCQDYNEFKYIVFGLHPDIIFQLNKLYILDNSITLKTHKKMRKMVDECENKKLLYYDLPPQKKDIKKISKFCRKMSNIIK